MTLKARTTYTVFVIMLFLLFVFQSSTVESSSNTQVQTISNVEEVATFEHTWAVDYIKAVNKRLTDFEAEMLARYALQYAEEFKLDAHLYLALIKVESGFQPEVKSSAGAIGLTQVIPRWHQTKIDEGRTRLGVYSMYEPKLNLYVGAWTLREMLDLSSNTRNGLLRYNGSLNTDSQYAATVLREAERVKRFRV